MQTQTSLVQEQYELQQQRLSSHNVSLHNSSTIAQQHELPPDLDRTTMIGSALDLDSLDGAEGASGHGGVAPGGGGGGGTASAASGSQVGLIAGAV